MIVKKSEIINISTLRVFFLPTCFTLAAGGSGCQHVTLTDTLTALEQHILMTGNVYVPLFRMIYDWILYNKQSNYRSY